MHECKPVFKLHIPKFAENAKQALLICQCKELKHVNMKQIQSLDKPLVDPMDAWLSMFCVSIIYTDLLAELFATY